MEFLTLSVTPLISDAVLLEIFVVPSAEHKKMKMFIQAYLIAEGSVSQRV